MIQDSSLQPDLLKLYVDFVYLLLGVYGYVLVLWLQIELAGLRCRPGGSTSSHFMLNTQLFVGNCPSACHS